MMAGLVDYYSILSSAGTFLTQDELRRFDIAVYQVLSNYAFLANWSMTSGLVRYNIVMKHHMMAHLPSMARMGGVNPRLLSTYTEESFISQRYVYTCWVCSSMLVCFHQTRPRDNKSTTDLEPG